MGGQLESRVRRIGWIVAALALTGALLPAPRSGVVAASSPNPLQSTLAAAARRLGWELHSLPNAELPGAAVQAASADGQQRVGVATLPSDGEGTFLSWSGWRGATWGLFHGREAIIATASQRAEGGLIAWRCGPQAFLAVDATGAGRQAQLAEVLHEAALSQGLCTHPSPIILAETREVRGNASAAHLRSLMAEAERYYARNAYGQVRFDLSLVRATGLWGQPSWITVPGTYDDYRGDGYDLAMAALRQALSGADLPATVHIERAVVVWSDGGQEASSPRLDASALWLSRVHAIEVAGSHHTSRVYVHNLVLLAESAPLGAWVHELGHTLPAHDEAEPGFFRIGDRYSQLGSARTNGQVEYWDLMGRGSLWGIPQGSAPTHMASYTKVMAGWLRCESMALGRDYPIRAVEHQRAGEAVLVLDDPMDDDPRSYYLFEARDGAGPYGAPASGVVIYAVAPGHRGERILVSMLSAQRGDPMGERFGQTYDRPTLHGLGAADGASEYVITGGLKVTLVAESMAPYRATIRVERLLAAAP